MKNELIEVVFAVLSTKSKRFLACSPHLNLVGFGKTEDEAVADFEKALDDFMEFHEKQGNLHAKLINLGYKHVDHKTHAPKDFVVPTELLERNQLQRSGSKSLRVSVPA